MTKVLTCKCDHKVQDAMHGPKMRVHNEVTKKDKAPWRCTVCLSEKGDRR